MEPHEWQRVKEIFVSALEQPDEARAQFLQTACGDNDQLRGEVESLLAANDDGEHIIEKKAFDLASAFRVKSFDGKQFGNYRIVREIGRGGMGTVFLAERADGEFRQQVAVKIIRQTVADSEIERHFKREREILASLNHPHIAKLFDGGVSGDGELFLLMEYIVGEPLMEFAERNDLAIEERLRLFLKVCAAVAYAHRNLVVHRDIKPSNILVERDGTPKLLDFGLARILDAGLNASDAVKTATQLRAFTPAYASPEQICGENVTTASDVYSLGVVLYELLTGERPFDFEGKNLEQIIKTVTEFEPSLPSQHQNPRSPILNSQPLKGDLDNIVLMALRKEPERRYKSIEAFAGDIEKYLQGLPVSARRNTFQYRAEKFVKRNTVGVVATAFVVLSLFIGLGAAVWQASVAREKAKIAGENQIRAEREAEKSREITRFMERILSYANPAWYAEGGRFKEKARVIDVLNDLSQRIETEFPQDLDIQAELHHKCAEIFLANLMIDRAAHHARRALETRRKIFGERHAETAKDLYYLGSVLSVQGKHLESENLLRQAAAIFREVAPDNANLPYLLEDLGGIITSLYNNFEEAEKLLTESLTLFRRRDGDNHNNTARLYFDLSVNAANRGDMARAEQLFREGETRTARLPNVELRLGTLIFRGRLESVKGNRVAAAATFTKLIDEIRKIRGANSALEREARSELINIYEREKNWAKAVEVKRADVEEMRKTSPETIAQLGTQLAWLSVFLLRADRPAEAKPVFEEAYRIFQDNKHDEEASLDLKTRIGECLLLMNRRAEALPLLEEIYEFYQAKYPPNFNYRIRAEELLKQARVSSSYENISVDQRSSRSATR